ncbi:MAG: TetR/AcrR family transcriptional regulator [Acutalibacteraceae bacterium]
MEQIRIDRRVVMTKRFLKGSLIEILKKKNIHETTIKEICSRADVNRTTFYNHYNSQYELYDEVISDVFEVMRKLQREVYDNKKLSPDEATKIFLKKVFEFAEENRELFLVILGNNGSISIGEAFTKYIDTFICDDKTSKYLRYCMQFISAGVSNILWLWLNEKDRIPAEKISEVISTLLQ